MSQRVMVALFLLLSLGFFLRTYRLVFPQEQLWDENHYVGPAKVLVGLGKHPGPAPRWKIEGKHSIFKSPDPMFSHPPLGKFLIGSSILIFGENAYGGRFFSALFGCLSLLIFLDLAKSLFSSEKFGAFATCLFAVESLHIAVSRIATLDVFMIFFLLAYLRAVIRIITGQATVGLYSQAAIFAALAISVKHVSALTVGSGILSIAVALIREKERSTGIFQVFRPVLLLSLSIPLVYGFWYAYYGLHGYSFGEWITLHQEVSDVVRTIKANHPDASPPWAWLLGYRAIVLTQGEAIPSYAVVAFLNPAFLLFSSISLVILGVRTMRRREVNDLFLLLWFGLGYLPLFVILGQRPGATFLHHFLPVTPCLCLVLARVVQLSSHPKRIAFGCSAAIGAISLLTWPLSVGQPIPTRFFGIVFKVVQNPWLESLIR
jgi:dolichyl-phosphate-mannose--protein O-mannosyl transferase